MPVVAVIGAAIGASSLGVTIGAAIGLSGAAAAVVGGAIGGAIGGGIGGGIGSVMMGGDFGDGFRSGAIGGLISGGFSGFIGADFAGTAGSTGAGTQAGMLAEQYAGFSAADAAAHMAGSGLGTSEIVNVLGNMGIDFNTAADLAQQTSGQFSTPNGDFGVMSQVVGPGGDLSNILPGQGQQALNTAGFEQGASDYISGDTFGISGSDYYDVLNGPAGKLPNLNTPTTLEGIDSSSYGMDSGIPVEAFVSPQVSSSPIGSTEGIDSFLGGVQSKIKDIMPQVGTSGGLGSIFSSPQGMMAISDTIAGYQQANQLEDLARQANAPYVQYMDMLKNPQAYWGADVDASARQMARAGRTGIAPALNTLMWQQHMKNLPSTMTSASNMAQQNFGNLAAAGQVRRNAPYQLGYLFTPQNIYGK